MNSKMKFVIITVAAALLSACGSERAPSMPTEGGHAAQTADFARGPHRGRLLSDGPFAIELAIFESGVPPEFHAWPTLEGKPLPPDQVELAVELTRLGDKIDRFTFTPKDDFLRAGSVVHEPHSFLVKVTAQHAGKAHEWHYESFEGRTRIAPEIAETAGIATESAGPATLVESLTLYGRITPDPARRREVSARFPGVIQAVNKKPGDTVRAGETLATIESNDSLEKYSVTAPIAGVITTRDANPGEQSASRAMFTIIDPAAVTAELSLFPADRARVRPGAKVRLQTAQGGGDPMPGKVARIDMQTSGNQSVIARVALDNPDGGLLVGSFVTAEVEVAQRKVPLAVKTSALQPFRDFTVVFERVADTYEVRMLELGETQGDWVEVLGGLEPGAHYVTANSYLIKADVEKSGASHDH